MSILPDWQILRDVKIEPFAENLVRPGVISFGVSSYGYDVRVGRHFKIFEPYSEVRSMTDAAAAWIAGKIDSHGWIQTAKDNGKSHTPWLSVEHSDLEMLNVLHSLTGVGKVDSSALQNESKIPKQQWRIDDPKHVHELLVRVLPYMHENREKAMCVVQHMFARSTMPIVDPKDFSSQAFVNIEADYCLIPPNSFALAETVEYMEIPRDILAVCLGKSTLARCGIVVNITPLEPEWRGKITIEISNTTPLPAKIYANEGIAQILFFRADDSCRISYADKNGRYQDQKGLTLPFVQGAQNLTS